MTRASIQSPRNLRGLLLGLLLVTHPIPSAIFVVAVGLVSGLAAAASHLPLDPGKFALLLAGVACAEVAIGSTNDYFDRELDARSRPEKPITRGLITPSQALTLACVSSAGVLALMAPLGPVPLVLGILIEGLGLAYDLGLKGTPFSALLYAAYFPLIPLVSWAVFGRWQPFLPWLLPVGALLGVAMNVANSLPDLEEDSAAGIRGLPHLLGMRRGLFTAWALPISALLLIWILDLTGTVPAHFPGMAVATASVLISTGLAIGLFAASPRPATLRSTFIMQALGALGLATGWVAAAAL